MQEIVPVKPHNFRWIVDQQLAGCARPETAAHVVWAADAGVRAIVSATPMSREAEKKARELGVDLLHLPIEDFDIPSEEQALAFIEFTGHRLAEGRPVLVHCMAGIGRTGTLCSLWLVHQGMRAEEALVRVGVETTPQRALLRRWETRRDGGQA